jgi:hypothetical protein
MKNVFRSEQNRILLYIALAVAVLYTIKLTLGLP